MVWRNGGGKVSEKGWEEERKNGKKRRKELFSLW